MESIRTRIITNKQFFVRNKFSSAGKPLRIVEQKEIFQEMLSKRIIRKRSAKKKEKRAEIVPKLLIFIEGKGEEERGNN